MSQITQLINNPVIVLIGNPNVGKSALFGKLTGKYAKVSNFPGTTVDITKSRILLNERDFTIIDSPGVNSLLPFSEDEEIARETLFLNELHSAVIVCDAKNLRRGLSLLLQVTEFGVSAKLALNMWDEVVGRGIRINTSKLSELTGLPVYATVATDGRGISALKAALTHESKPHVTVHYPSNIEESIRKIEKLISNAVTNHNNIISDIKSTGNLLSAKRGIAVALLSGDKTIARKFHGSFKESDIKQINDIVTDCSIELGDNLKTAIEEFRSLEAQKLAEQVTRRSESRRNERKTRSSYSLILTHPFYGIFPALTALVIMFLFVGQFAAGTAVDFFESIIFGEILIPYIEGAIRALSDGGIIYRLLVGEYGLISMGLTYALAIILPIVTAFFLFFGLLEDSGYLPCLSVMLNNMCKKIGVNGKAIVPMVLGLGCDTMAVVTTRVLETRRERLIVSALLTITIPCSAKLGVLFVMAGGFTGESLAAAGLRATIWFAILIFTIWFVGFISSKALKGTPSDLILDIPPLRLPSLKNIWVKTFSRLRWYIMEAVPLFLIGTLILFAIAETGLLTYVRQGASPIVQYVLGLPEQATDAIIMGFFRRDYGAAGFSMMFSKGIFTGTQLLVSMVVITFLVPCIAQVLVLKKEVGSRIAFSLAGISIVYAILLGGAVNLTASILGL